MAIPLALQGQSNVTRELFEHINSPYTSMRPPTPRTLTSRPVKPNFDVLRDAGVGGSVGVNLFPDGIFIGVIRQKEIRSQGSYSVSGEISGQVLATFSLVVNNGVMVGIFRLPLQHLLFRLDYIGNGAHVIQLLDSTLASDCGVDERAKVTQPNLRLPKRGATSPLPTYDDGSTIDVMVLYTNVARSAAGGKEAMESWIQLAVDLTNVAYWNSHITTRMRLVHTEEVQSDESASLDSLFGQLINPTDGFIDNVESIRQLYGADLVSLLVNRGDVTGHRGTGDAPGSGNGDLTPLVRDKAFSAINWEAAAEVFSLAHETGHNLGCGHNRADCTGCGVFPYSHGRCLNLQLDETIMAKCSGYERLQYFSNPDITLCFDPDNVICEAIGKPPGDADEADNALTINLTAFTVANYSQSIYWSDFTYTGTNAVGSFDRPFSSLLDAIGAAPSGGLVRAMAGTKREIFKVSKKMRIEAYGGTVTIGRSTSGVSSR